MKTISKSRFLSGIQCHKKLWFDYFRKDLRLPTDPSTQRLFDLGHEIGRLAQKKFPNGKDATPENFYDLKPATDQTKQWLNQNVKTIYEATFISGNASAMLDILHQEGDELWAIEVKNSTDVKDYHVQDASLQYYVMNNAGFTPDRFFLMHINNQYVKQGEITDEIFILNDITEQVICNQEWVKANLGVLLKITQSATEPLVDIGTHCGIPFGCDYQHECWKHIPENSVFGLTRGGKKSWELYSNNILALNEIPEDFPLTFNQQLQVEGIRNGKEYLDSESILSFLNSWEHPLHYFDFETINPAIPLLDGTRPYQQIPFLYSLHIEKQNSDHQHFEFLAKAEDFKESTIDPRKKMIEQMKADFEDSGSIVTYNMSFEKMILGNLCNDFPEDAPFLRSLIDRIVDLLPIFRSRWYYKPAMGGSMSIKSVLPAILPHLSYKDLEIQDGGTASESFLQSVLDPANNSEELRENLLKYCELDTWAMVEIYEHLNALRY